MFADIYTFIEMEQLRAVGDWFFPSMTPLQFPYEIPYFLPRAHWAEITRCLLPFIDGRSSNWEDAIIALETIIWSSHQAHSHQADLSVLYEFIRADAAEEFEPMLPFIAQWALEAKDLFPQQIPILKKGISGIAGLNRAQIRSLLALMFWCAFPAARSSLTSSSNSFIRVFGQPKHGRSAAQQAKLHCLFRYFQANMSASDQDFVYFRRVTESVSPPRDPYPLQPVSIITGPAVHVESYPNCIQVDFADKSFGGGVLGSGSAQEECMLLAYMEPIVGLLLVEELQGNEVLYINGARVVNELEGFSSGMRWKKCVYEPADDRIIVAMDAEDFRKREYAQYQPKSILRELNKALLAFSASNAPAHFPIVTGNWGCGVFKGDPQLKFLIQWLAASFCRREMVYLTWDNPELSELKVMVEYIRGFSTDTVLQAMGNLQPSGQGVLRQVGEWIARR